MTDRKENTPLAADWVTPIELLLVGAIWGSSFLFLRIAAQDFGPFAIVETRIVLGAAILWPFLWRARAQITRAHWRRFALIGALNSAIPFSLFAWSAERAPAGVSAIANSLTVLFVALIGWLVYRERIGPRSMIALAVGFVGVVILMSGKFAGASVAPAAMAGALAALLYGFAINFVRRWLADVPPLAAVAGTLTCGAVMIAPFAAATWPEVSPPLHSWLSAITLGVVCTGVAYALMFRLIQRVGSARAATCQYLIPLFGVFWAWLFLGENPTPTMLVAGALILGSVIVSQREKAPPAVTARGA